MAAIPLMRRTIRDQFGPENIWKWAKLEALQKQRDLQKWYLYDLSKILQNHGRVTSAFPSSIACGRTAVQTL